MTNLDPPFPEDMIIYHLSMGGNRTDSIGNRISDDHTITATDCPLDLKGYMKMDIRNRRQQLHEIKLAI